MNIKKCFGVLTIVCMSCFWATQSWAQQQEELTDGNKAFLVLSSTSMPFFSTFSVAGSAIKSRENELREDIKRLESIVKIEKYLNNNERAVRTAIALGGGASLVELVALIDHRYKFNGLQGKMVRKKRTQFGHILSVEGSFDRAARLYDNLRPIMEQAAMPLAYVSVFNQKKEKGQ